MIYVGKKWVYEGMIVLNFNVSDVAKARGSMPNPQIVQNIEISEKVEV